MNILEELKNEVLEPYKKEAAKIAATKKAEMLEGLKELPSLIEQLKPLVEKIAAIEKERRKGIESFEEYTEVRVGKPELNKIEELGEKFIGIIAKMDGYLTQHKLRYYLPSHACTEFTEKYTLSAKINTISHYIDRFTNHARYTTAKAIDYFDFFNEDGTVSNKIIEALENFDYEEFYLDAALPKGPEEDNVFGRSVEERVNGAYNIFELKKEIDMFLRQTDISPKAKEKILDIKSKIEKLEKQALKEEAEEDKQEIPDYSNDEGYKSHGVVKGNGVLLKVTQKGLEFLFEDPEEFWEGVEEIGPEAFAGLDFTKFSNREQYNTKGHMLMTKSGFSPNAKFDIPATVKKIGRKAFSKCTNLTSVNTYATEIKQEAFADIKELEAVFTPHVGVQIGSGVFKGTKLTDIFYNYRSDGGINKRTINVVANEETMERFYRHRDYLLHHRGPEELPEELLKAPKKQSTKKGDNLEALFSGEAAEMETSGKKLGSLDTLFNPNSTAGKGKQMGSQKTTD